MKALEILKQTVDMDYPTVVSRWDILQAIAELEALQAPKTCEKCVQKLGSEKK